MPVRTKSIYDPPARTDGRRVLVTRYWPRGVSRDRVDEYVSTPAPSRDLLRAYKDGQIQWRELASEYRRQMRGEEQRAEIARLAETGAERTITLMCTCRDDAQCHRRILRALVEAKLKRPAKAR